MAGREFSDDAGTPIQNLTPAGQLRRILGLGFALAFAFGTMVGVGILRLPGMVAGAAGSPALIVACWCLGGVYALMGAVSVSELVAMQPEAGGLRVFVRRGFGDRAGFISGWIDWLACVATLSYAAVAAVDFLATLWPAVAQWQQAGAIGVLAAFGLMHSAGLRLGSSITTVASTCIGILLLALVVACFVAAPAAPQAGAAALAPAAPALASAGTLLAIAPALRALLTAYDGWYAPIYTAEECVDAARNLPRAIIGGALIVMAMYVAINVALLRVLPVPALAASVLPAADAARAVLPQGSATLMTALSILIVLSLVNGNCIMAPRVLFSIAREGWISPKAAAVSRGGTPWVALAVSMATAALMILTGSFDNIISLFAVLILLNYIATFLSVFALRHRLPDAPRPFRAWGYPFSTAVVLAGSLVFLVATVAEDWRAAVTAVIFLSLCVPAYALAAKSRRAALQARA